MRSVLLGLATTSLVAGSCLAQDDTRLTADAAGGTNEVAGHPRTGLNPSTTLVAPPVLEEGANSFTAAQARARLEGAGLVAVTDLHEDSRGIWRGRATRNGVPVSVGFDFRGNIATQ